MRARAAALALAWLASAAAQPPVPRGELASGRAFLSEDLRRLELDELANPGLLWVARGEALWREEGCAACHGEPARLRGAAARHPVAEGGRLLNLEGRINQCRTERQGRAALAYESEALLALTALVARQSLGLPLAVRVDGEARPFFEAGRARYAARAGQMNLACTHCHDANRGRRLYTETISQGHPNAFPAYRLEWETLGSLHRRLRACHFGVRAEMLPAGSQAYLELELYLAWRAGGLAVEAPGVRR
jgi:sulfur-oxidizing protein SoxA